MSNSDVTGVSLTLQNGTRLRGQVVFEGAPPPAERPRFSLTLVPANDRTLGVFPAAPIDENLRFMTARYPAGRYLLSVASAPPGWTAVEARIGSVNAIAEPVTLDGSAVGDVTVTLTNRTTRLSGTVKGATTGDPNATVILFPFDHRSWIESGMATRLLRTVDVRPDGSYEITNLIPGSYAVVAVSATAVVDTRDSSVVDALARGATRVTLAVGDQKAQPLSVSPVR